jgi:DNA-binding beta-propeller fold protein YncE
MLKPRRGRKVAEWGRSSWRRVWLAELSAVILVCSLTATAWAVGELTQKSGTAGCISHQGSGGCQPGIGLEDARSVATSPDGKNVYVASEFSDAVAIFNRNLGGTLEQPPGTAGCISQGGVGGCQAGYRPWRRHRRYHQPRRRERLCGLESLPRRGDLRPRSSAATRRSSAVSSVAERIRIRAANGFGFPTVTQAL